jgi:hypothetical protein
MILFFFVLGMICGAAIAIAAGLVAAWPLLTHRAGNTCADDHPPAAQV